MKEVLKKFGRYFLLDLIAQGGMAEIYRARLANLETGRRLIVIKRIQAGFGSNQEFLQMFRAEIKNTMGFSHTNIVQLFDFGEEQNQPYIAMEYVDGKNLRQFISWTQEAQLTIPVELAVYILSQAASGVHYAHTYKDKISGEPLNIIHRDISPQNIIISYEGGVKVIDFGISKATALSNDFTRAGVIKGKPSYLSPEQITGESLDGRCDIFALGIVLWEILAGRKLFAADNDLAVLKLIESCNTHVKPPSTYNTHVSAELDAIVLKALAKNRDDRYQTAEEFERVLRKYLARIRPEFSPSDLAYFIKEVFKDEIVDDRKRIQKLNEKVETLLQLSNLNTPVNEKNEEFGLERDETTTMIKSSDSSGSRELIDPFQTQKINDLKRLGMGGINRRSLQEVAVPYRVEQVQIQRQRPNWQKKKKVVEVRKSSQSNIGKILPGIVAAGIAALMIFGANIKTSQVFEWIERFTPKSVTRLMFQGDQKNVSVVVNGHAVGDSLPLTVEAVPVGVPVHVMVTSASGYVFEQDLNFNRGETKKVSVNFTAASKPARETASKQPEATILLRLNVLPSGGDPTIKLNGIPLDRENPFSIVKLDAPLELIVERSGFRSFRREFVLDSQKLAGTKEQQMEVQLEPLMVGYLTIRSTPSADATIMIDGRPFVKKTPFEREKLPVGTYTIRLNNSVLGMEKNVTVTIHEGKVAVLDESLEIKD